MLNKKIDIGVESVEELEVGYDAAGGNMEVDQDEVPEGTLLFYDFVSSSSPLPVEDIPHLDKSIPNDSNVELS